MEMEQSHLQLLNDAFAAVQTSFTLHDSIFSLTTLIKTAVKIRAEIQRDRLWSQKLPLVLLAYISEYLTLGETYSIPKVCKLWSDNWKHPFRLVNTTPKLKSLGPVESISNRNKNKGLLVIHNRLCIIERSFERDYQFHLTQVVASRSTSSIIEFFGRYWLNNDNHFCVRSDNYRIHVYGIVDFQFFFQKTVQPYVNEQSQIAIDTTSKLYQRYSKSKILLIRDLNKPVEVTPVVFSFPNSCSRFEVLNEKKIFTWSQLLSTIIVYEHHSASQKLDQVHEEQFEIFQDPSFRIFHEMIFVIDTFFCYILSFNLVFLKTFRVFQDKNDSEQHVICDNAIYYCEPQFSTIFQRKLIFDH